MFDDKIHEYCLHQILLIFFKNTSDLSFFLKAHNFTKKSQLLRLLPCFSKISSEVYNANNFNKHWVSHTNLFRIYFF